jgi:alternate signal-mediated exported protein
MNKLVKGAIAGASGFALLLGGAGTLASWNASTSLSNATIHSGSLTVTPADNAAWTEQGADGSAVEIDSINDYRIVPGDVLTYTRTFNVNAHGDNLKFSAAVTGALEGGPLADELKLDIVSHEYTNVKVSDNVYSLVDPDQPGTVTFVATVKFPFDSATNNSMSSWVSLAPFQFVLKQVQ